MDPRDEMFRLTKLRMSQFQTARQIQGAAFGTSGKPEGGKKGKPVKEKANPNQPSKKKEEKKKEEKPSTFVPDNTPKGQKKDFSKTEMLPDYHPKNVEAAWYAWWEKKGFFHADAQKVIQGKKMYTMVIPPPNVTGALHLGHALMLTIEDAIMRWRRMSGYETLWLPGVDHAGIATQTVVEKQIMKLEGKTRHDYGREDFVKKVWDWKHQYGGKIEHQFRRFGICVDWERNAFTLDDTRSKAVTEAFVRMYEKGLIYRDNRLVNWSCTLKTAVSDLEVEHIDLLGPTMRKVPGHDQNKEYEFGVLIHFTYQVKGTNEFIEVATTRLETMLGDVAVAVHPNDERYKKYHGKELVHPFIPDRKMVVITDGILVDMNFGTGAVKITPAHDPNDYAAGKRAGLAQINILDEDGLINEVCPQFKGMKRFDARVAVYDALNKIKQIKGKSPNPMRLGLCQRSGDIIEPYLKPQWWVDCKDMAKRSTDAVRNGELQIIPKDPHEDTWFRWLDNIQDWCISRQLWWGHRIPVYLITIPGVIDTPDVKNNDHWVVGRNVDEARNNAAKKFNVSADKVKLEQDEDVLDTWFSSGLFPFSTMGWPDNTNDMKAFFPGNLLETGHDILFFWVARMVMMSLELTDKLPFTQVFLHPMVKDENGAKMSKSKGNVIDPLEVIDGCNLDVLLSKLRESNLPPKEIEESIVKKTDQFPDGIPECGTDALRFTLMNYMVQQGINLDVQRIIGYKQFCNKLWNINKFALRNFDANFKPSTGHKLSLSDKWILTRLSALITRTNDQFENYDFGNMSQAIYDFWYKDLADNYLEACKPAMSEGDENAKNAVRNTLFICLDSGLRLLHPTMPYITEELYQRLPDRANQPESITIAPFPTGCDSFEGVEETFDTLQDLVKKFRSQLAALNVTKQMAPKLYVRITDAKLRQDLAAETAVIKSLVKSGDVTIIDEKAKDPAGSVSSYVSDKITNYVIVPPELAKAEMARLEKANKQLQGQIDSLKKQIANPNYAKVPEQKQKKDAEKLQNSQNEFEANLKSMEKMKNM